MFIYNHVSSYIRSCWLLSLTIRFVWSCTLSYLDWYRQNKELSFLTAKNSSCSERIYYEFCVHLLFDRTAYSHTIIQILITCLILWDLWLLDLWHSSFCHLNQGCLAIFIALKWFHSASFNQHGKELQDFLRTIWSDIMIAWLSHSIQKMWVVSAHDAWTFPDRVKHKAGQLQKLDLML